MSGYDEPQAVGQPIHDPAIEVRRLHALESGEGRTAGEWSVGITFNKDGETLTFGIRTDAARHVADLLREAADLVDESNR